VLPPEGAALACLHHHLVGSEPLPFAEPGVGPSYPPDRAVRITHATLRLQLDPYAQSFSGEADLHISPFPGYGGRFEIDLDEVEVDAVTDGEGAPLAYEHVDGQVCVTAEAPPAVVRVRWHGSHPRRGLYFTGPTEAAPSRSPQAWTQCQDEDGHFVFPCHDHPSVKHPWTLELSAPEGYTLLSNGQRAEEGLRDGRAWARFEQHEPMPAYLVTFVAARLAVVETRWQQTPVRYLVPPEGASAVERAFGRTPEMIEQFSQVTGVPYPWPRYDQVVVDDFVFGGMENVACTTMTEVLLVDEKAALEWDPDSLVSHELAHQWFGNLVTCQDWSQAWLNESWATVMEAVWVERSGAPAEGTWYRWETAQGYHHEHGRRYRRPIVSYTFREPIDLFDRHLYNKGSCVLWTLRHELGDEPFWAGVRRYLEAHRHGTVHTRHFQRAMEEVSGRNLERFFTQWVYGVGHPALDVKLSQDSKREGQRQLHVTVKQTQQGEGVAEVFWGVLRLELVPRDGQARTVDLQLDARERTYVVPLDHPLKLVRVDPGYRLLAEIKLSAPDEWLEQLATDDCPVLALRAVRALVALGSPRALAGVRRALTQHPFYGVRGQTASELGGTATESARATLIEALRTESEPRARRAIAAALGSFRHPAAADALLALLEEDLPTWQLHGAALLALGQTRDPRAVEALTRHLDTPSWADWVRQHALKGLAETEDRAVHERIVAHSRAAFSDRCRAGAAAALARLADGVPDLRKAVVERLMEMVQEPGFHSQLAAIGALGRLQDPRAEGLLSQVHRTAPDGRARRQAFEALAWLRKGRTTDEGLSAMRRRLDTLVEDNAKLRERIDRLER
jgi:aminopeptidase N